MCGRYAVAGLQADHRINAGSAAERGPATAAEARFVERGSRRHARRIARLANSSSAAAGLVDLAQRPPTLLLRHARDPAFAICPIRLAGAEPIMRYFVRRSAPAATTAPLCFPDSPNDRCPSRHGARRHRSRWGSYPFEIHSVEHGSSQAGFTFAFVRNPFDRLVSAYDRHIAAQTKETAVHRAWIREQHGLGDRDTISFSHFVRWLAQQDANVMHNAWRPYSEICGFDRGVTYDFIGRLEHLQRDVAHVMDKLKIDAAERQLWEQVSSKTKPLQAIGGHDRTLRLQHYYQSDDAHDLIGIVQLRYAEDLSRWGYSYPGNHSAVPHWQRREVLSRSRAG